MPTRPPLHRPAGQRTKRERKAEADQRRGSARDRGYTSRWDSAALAFRREHALCLGCQAVGKIAAADVVDHVEPHKGDMFKFWNRAMWQSACRWHHDTVKQQLEAMYANGSITIHDLWLNSEKAKQITLSR